MSEKMRDEFEVECSKLGWDLTRQASANSEYYNHTVVNLCWTFWQASRAALVVELPSDINGEYYADGWNAALMCVEGMLEEAGVSYK